MKIVGIGLNKTGTTTLGTCLVHWGFKHISYSKPAFDLWRKNDFDKLWQFTHNYDSFEDWPWPLVYREMDEKYPGSKFILTTRKNSETWFRSLCKHAHRTGPTEFRKVIYGFEMPFEHPTEHMEYYVRHNRAVREYFHNRQNDFLEVCWENGDGWNELSEFLNLPRPSTPFPHSGKSPTNPIEYLFHNLAQALRRTFLRRSVR